MLSAVRMAILAASTVGACSDTSRIFLSTNSASSRMYAGSPAARTEYVWPKISTCGPDGRSRSTLRASSGGARTLFLLGNELLASKRYDQARVMYQRCIDSAAED